VAVHAKGRQLVLCAETSAARMSLAAYIEFDNARRPSDPAATMATEI
jgi:hypothetical protein